MKLSLNWLRDYVTLDAPVDELCRAITFLGFEVEGVHRTGAPMLENVVAGKILTRAKHPNADKLSICTVDAGPAHGVKTIVCGAPNCDAGNYAPLALPGAVLPGNFVIKRSKIRGQESDGMLCASDELGLGGTHSGLLLLDGQPAPGTPLNDVLPPGDTVFDVEITPNRPDCQSHLGIARELAAWFRTELRYPGIKFDGTCAEAERRDDLLSQVSVDAPDDCPLYIAHVITGVKIGPSPDWLQERLTAVGLRPINNVVDAGNYVMLEYGQPLHAFDAAKLAGGRIIVRRARTGERIVTLDGKERELDPSTLVIADAQRPVVIAGIMGGEDSGVGAETVDLVLECAVFRRQSVRQTSRRLGLSSDSSYRYERGVDVHMAMEAAHRAIDLIQAAAGGEVAGPALTVGGDVPWEREIVITHDFVGEKLGFEIPAPEIREALEALDLTVSREEPTEQRGLAWTVAVPSWRQDLDRPIDLVEEVLRMHGTERIPAGRVEATGLTGDDDPAVRFNRRVTDYLVGHDFHECVNYTLRSARELSGWTPEAALAGLALANPFVAEQSHLRPTLITGLLDTLKLNQSRGVVAARLSETGRVFIEHEGQNLECLSAAFIVAEDGVRRWLHRDAPDFYTVKRHAADLAAMAGIDLARQPATGTAGGAAWQEGHATRAGGMAQGWTLEYGLLSLATLKALGIEGKVYAGALTLLPEHLGKTDRRNRFVEFSLFPAALRDLAVVVQSAVPAGTVRGHLLKAAQAAAVGAFAVESVELFDVYQGEGLPAGHKSLAFGLVFRAPDRTLTDDEVNAAFQRLRESLTKNTGYRVRD